MYPELQTEAGVVPVPRDDDGRGGKSKYANKIFHKDFETFKPTVVLKKSVKYLLTPGSINITMFH